MQSNNKKVINYLIKENYLETFTIEEIENVFLDLHLNEQSKMFFSRYLIFREHKDVNIYIEFSLLNELRIGLCYIKIDEYYYGYFIGITSTDYDGFYFKCKDLNETYFTDLLLSDDFRSWNFKEDDICINNANIITAYDFSILNKAEENLYKYINAEYKNDFLDYKINCGKKHLFEKFIPQRFAPIIYLLELGDIPNQLMIFLSSHWTLSIRFDIS